MVPDAWLGFYSSGHDPFEERLHRLHLFRSGEVLHVEHYHELNGNHGYSVGFQEGTVTSRVGDELGLRLVGECASSWEDYFKEHHTSVSTAVSEGVVQIRERPGSTPFLTFNGVDMYFHSVDDFAMTSLFARARAEMAGLRTQG